MVSILGRRKGIKPPKKSREDYAEDALYREVWEEVKNEKTHAFIKRYYKYLVAGAVIVVIIAVVIELSFLHHKHNKIAMAANYEIAIQNMDASALAALSNKASGASADLALFQSYVLDRDISKLEKLATKGHTRDFRDLAKIHIVNIKGDSMTGKEVEKYLSDMNSKKSPFYYVSRLTIAQKYLSEDNKKAANKWLNVILNDKNAPAVIAASAKTLK